jgi:hypothetical protein
MSVEREGQTASLGELDSGAFVCRNRQLNVFGAAMPSKPGTISLTGSGVDDSRDIGRCLSLTIEAIPTTRFFIARIIGRSDFRYDNDPWPV